MFFHGFISLSFRCHPDAPSPIYQSLEQNRREHLILSVVLMQQSPGTIPSILINVLLYLRRSWTFLFDCFLQYLFSLTTHQYFSVKSVPYVPFYSKKYLNSVNFSELSHNWVAIFLFCEIALLLKHCGLPKIIYLGP